MILTIFDEGIPCHTRSYESIVLCHWLGPLQRSAEKRSHDENSESSFPDELCRRFMRWLFMLPSALSCGRLCREPFRPGFCNLGHLTSPFKIAICFTWAMKQWTPSFLSATLAGGAKACRRHSQVLEADSEMQQEFYKFTWSTKMIFAKSSKLAWLPG